MDDLTLFYFQYLFCFRIVEPIVASYDDLTQFHSRDYIDYLKQFNDSCDQYDYNEESDLFGIGDLYFRNLFRTSFHLFNLIDIISRIYMNLKCKFINNL